MSHSSTPSDRHRGRCRCLGLACPHAISDHDSTCSIGGREYHTSQSIERVLRIAPTGEALECELLLWMAVMTAGLIDDNSSPATAVPVSRDGPGVFSHSASLHPQAASLLSSLQNPAISQPPSCPYSASGPLLQALQHFEPLCAGPG